MKTPLLPSPKQQTHPPHAKAQFSSKNEDAPHESSNNCNMNIDDDILSEEEY